MIDRKQRERRAYMLIVTAIGAAVAAVVLFLLAVFSSVGIGLALLAALVAGGAGYGAKRTLSPGSGRSLNP